MSGSRIKALQASLFGTRQYVCGGHGARWPSDGTFIVPNGIVIYFYVPDGDSLGNDIGQKVDQVLAGGTAPAAVETIRSGAPCHDYRLFSNKAGGYLNLAMSSSAEPANDTPANVASRQRFAISRPTVSAMSTGTTPHW